MRTKLAPGLAASLVVLAAIGKLVDCSKILGVPIDQSSDCTAHGKCAKTPSYAQILQAKGLWSCPKDDRGAYGAVDPNTCTKANFSKSPIENPLCDFGPQGVIGCCCPLDGCYTAPRFNWILSTCYDGHCGGTQTAKKLGSQLVVNYVAAYGWDRTTNTWVMDDTSSFNTDHAYPAYDTIKKFGGLSENQSWLNPQPGGASGWGLGFYPAGDDVRGVGPASGHKAIMFVLSTEFAWNFAWYMLNQLTLNRGPANQYPKEYCQGVEGFADTNCWSAGNGGEIDFLESPWTVTAGESSKYRPLFATNWNQVGRSFIDSHGKSGNADGGWFSNEELTTNYFLGTDPDDYVNNKSTPYVWAAVVEQRGTFIYRLPVNNITGETPWPGLSRHYANATLTNATPNEAPPKGGPCLDDSPYCALFTPNCQATVGGRDGGTCGDTTDCHGSCASNEQCGFNAQQGFCRNWLAQDFVETGQKLWGSKQVFVGRNPVRAMPWNEEMEAKKVRNWPVV